jgi:ABC-type transport system substrate-binding protein
MPRYSLAAIVVCALAVAPAAPAADMNKILRVAVQSAETGFDPQAISDLYSSFVTRVIFDPLYQYDYLARPFKIVPNTAVAMPQISADGKTWTIKLKPGIYFADDPAFGGKQRELTAGDYIYTEAGEVHDLLAIEDSVIYVSSEKPVTVLDK